MHWLKGILSLLILFSPWQVRGDTIEQLIIVKSSDNSYYNQTIETLVSHVDQAIRINVIVADRLDSQALKNGPKNLFVALGQPAARALSSYADSANSINSYLTHEQYHSLDFNKTFTVLLDQPLRRYLLFSKFMLQLKSIGVISENYYELSSPQKQLLQEIELEFNQYRVDAKNKLLPVLRKLLKQNDALLMLPQRSIYNRDSLKGVLLTSYRNRKPVISYSPAHAKAGALASIYSSPTDIGRHLAIIINERLANNNRLDSNFEYARFYSIKTNNRVARSLGLNLPTQVELRARIDELGR